MDHFPYFRGEYSKNIWVATTQVSMHHPCPSWFGYDGWRQVPHPGTPHLDLMTGRQKAKVDGSFGIGRHLFVTSDQQKLTFTNEWHKPGGWLLSKVGFYISQLGISCINRIIHVRFVYHHILHEHQPKCRLKMPYTMDIIHDIGFLYIYMFHLL